MIKSHTGITPLQVSYQEAECRGISLNNSCEADALSCYYIDSLNRTDAIHLLDYQVCDHNQPSKKQTEVKRSKPRMRMRWGPTWVWQSWEGSWSFQASSPTAFYSACFPRFISWKKQKTSPSECSGPVWWVVVLLWGRRSFWRRCRDDRKLK